MNKGNLIGIDLSKYCFQVCLLNEHNHEVFNRTFTRKSLTNWLSKQSPLVVAMEACGSAHHWARVVRRLGHRPLILPTRSVTAFRLGHKTDASDARACAIAARQPKLKCVAPKSLEQQGMQGVERIRQHLSDHLTATGNLIRGLLNEFGIVVPKGICAFKRALLDVLDDTDNELPMAFRLQLIESWHYYLELQDRVTLATQARDRLITQHPSCQQLMQLVSVGPVNALGLYLSLGERGASFANGREAAACIGLTPKQYSTAGRITLGGISKHCANKRLRSTLIQGARSAIQAVHKREARNATEAWLQSLIARRGEGRAAVALANKTTRVAWAMLHYGDKFRVQPTSTL